MRSRPYRCSRRAVAAVLVITAVGCAEQSTVNTTERSKIGFIFVGTRDDLGYNQAAWEGADAVAKTFPDHRVVRAERVPESAVAERVMEEMIREGARLIFATSFGHRDAAYAVAKRHPTVVVVHQGGIEPQLRLDNFGTYWGTVYEPVYQAGIAAGAASRSGRLGFVAAFPIPATFANVNAFTLGARSVNPEATTRVEFTGAWCETARQRAVAARLLANGVDVMTQHQDCTRTILEMAERANVRSVGYHYDGSEVAPRSWLLGAVWNWSPLFIEIARVALAGRFAASPFNGDYRGGYAQGDNPFVLTEASPQVAATTQALIDAAAARFAAGATPFDGPVTARDGTVRVAAGARPTVEEIDRMNWFVTGVAGEAPPASG